MTPRNTITCPNCGHVGESDDFDNAGVCLWWYVFCNECGCEFARESGETHDSETCAVCLARPKVQGKLFTESET